MLKTVAVTTLLSVAYYSAFSQNDEFNFRYDTLSLKEILNLQAEGQPQFNLVDTVRLELYLESKLIAILPADMKQFINEAEISLVKYSYETLADSRILKKVQMFIKPPAKE